MSSPIYRTRARRDPDTAFCMGAGHRVAGRSSVLTGNTNAPGRLLLSIRL